MNDSKEYSNMSVTDMEKNIDDKIKNILGAEYNDKPKEYHWDNPSWNVYKDKLAQRLKIENPYWASDAYENIAEEILSKINPVLEKNLVEYINGEPFSDIPIGTEKFTLKEVLRLRNNIGGTLEALKDLSIYSVDEQFGRTRIINRYARYTSR